MADSSWQPPTALPDLRHVGVTAIDTETRDDGLRADRGPAWPWRGGYVCGISVAYHADGDIRAHYFPLRHPDSPNFDPAQVFAWLKDLVASDVRFVTQNGLYDWGWLRADADIKMPPADRLEEIGALATMIDENRFSYSLDNLCAWRGLPGKDTALLREAVKTAGWAPRKRSINVAEHIHKLPAHLVGPYAEADAIATLALFESLDPILDREGTRDAYRLEVDLLPMVHEMRLRGIRIDQDAAERARDLLMQKRDATFAELSEKLGASVGMEEIGRTKWLAETFDQHSIAYPRTTKGNPSFTLGWMPKHAHWLPRLIVKADKYNNAAVKFLENYILGHTVNGRVHAEIHPHRSDEGGTRSLRFSYSHPPLQQVPAHDEELAPLIRGVFLPEDGEVWCKPDISQQEFRFIVHYAARHKLPKASEAVERYRADPNTDFHALVAEMTGIERQSAKNTNFAKAFGAGVRKFAEMIGKPESEARAIYDRYDRELPFVSKLSKLCESAAKRKGFLTLYDGARRHWDDWVAPAHWGKGDQAPCSREEGERRVKDPSHSWHRQWLKRVDTHKAMNALIQGSAARHTKLWMRACWREGFVPLVQMHDALDCSVTTREQGELVARLGCEAVTLEVPMRVDLKFGPTWAAAKYTGKEWDDINKPAPAKVPVKEDNMVEELIPAIVSASIVPAIVLDPHHARGAMMVDAGVIVAAPNTRDHGGNRCDGGAARDKRDAREVARDYLARGWRPVPVPFRSKKPVGDEWQRQDVTAENVDRLFHGRQNVGVQLGPRSRGLADIDLDCAEAIALASTFLPRTDAVFGRASQPQSHRLFYIDDAPAMARVKLTDENGEVVAELRLGGGDKGAQTVFPGSTHEDGETIEWVRDGEPARSNFATLEAAVIQIAAATVLARAWPAEGSRHDAVLALGGFLARAGWPADEVGGLAEAAARLAGDKELRDRRRAAADSVVAHARGVNVGGLPKLIEHFGEPAASKVAEFIGYGREAEAYEAPSAIIKLADWLDRDLPTPDFLLGSWLSTTSRVFLFAPTGIGKTMIVVGAGMAIAHGSAFLHWQGRRPARVLFVDGEMSRRLLKARLIDEVRRFGHKPEGFHALSHEDIENFAPLNTKEGQVIIEREIERCGGVDLIQFDNVMSLIAGDQKDEEGWRQTLPWIRSLTRRSIGQIWVHHTGHDESHSYGTKTREWQMDTVIGLEAVEQPDASVSFQLNFRKARERTPDTWDDFEDVCIALIDGRWVSTGAPKGMAKVPPLAMKFLEALRAACTACGNQMDGHPAATIEEWRTECVKRGLLEVDKNNRARAMFSKEKLALIAANRIACDETMAWILT